MRPDVIRLRKLKPSDQKYFARWWCDQSLIKLTSGNTEESISNTEIGQWVRCVVKADNAEDLHFMITRNGSAIGHVTLVNRRNGWHETQIVIGEKNSQGRGYGTQAIKSLVRKAKKLGLSKICLEVRPDNTRAIRAYEKCGFRPAGIKKYPRNRFLPQTLKMTLEG